MLSVLHVSLFLCFYTDAKGNISRLFHICKADRDFSTIISCHGFIQYLLCNWSSGGSEPNLTKDQMKSQLSQRFHH